MSYWTPERDARLWRLYAEHGPDWAAIEREWGEPVTRSQIRNKAMRGKPRETDGAPASTTTEPGTIVSRPSPTVCSLEELLAQADVDLDVWTVDRHVVNSWEQRPGEQLFQVKAWLSRKVPLADEQFAAALLADIQADTAARSRLRARQFETPVDDETHALEICVFDIHIGKHAWDEETGHGNYDAGIAAELAQLAVDDLLAQSRLYKLDRIILPIGNDLLHADNLVATTTAGTRQDVDSRYHRMFRRARALMSWTIERCAQRAPVEVIVVPGNHDTVSAWTIGQVLAAEYANDPRVTFDDSPKRRKYVRYGRNFIGYTHGNAEPLAKLPQIMATERKHDWAATDFREWHVGHLHHQKKLQPVMVDDKEGVTVRICRSLSAPDSWHAEYGWVGAQRGAEAFLWRQSGGLRAHLHYCVAASEDAERKAA